jgi:hypothetical protein
MDIPAVLDDLEAGIGRLDLASAGLDSEQMGAVLVRLRRLINLAELQFAAGSAVVAADPSWAQDGLSPYQWIRENTHMTGTATFNAVAVGDQAAALPLTVQALERGDIGIAHMNLMATTADFVASRPGDQRLDEARMLAIAQRGSLKQFRDACTSVRHEADARAFLLEQVDAVDHRRLDVTTGEGGAVFVSGSFDAEGGATVRTVLEALAAPRGADDDRPRAKRMADAMVELARHGLDLDDLTPRRAGRRPHLVITASLETLLAVRGAPAADLEWGSSIAADTVQRVACDANIMRLIFDGPSVVVDVGRTQRVASEPQRRAVTARDRACVWPGCDRPPSWCDVHHVKHWLNFGRTEVDNLVLLCHRHHWLAHEGGWQLAMDPDNGVVVTSPWVLQNGLAREPALAET